MQALKIQTSGLPLVPRLRLCISSAGVKSSISGWGTKIPHTLYSHGQKKKKKCRISGPSPDLPNWNLHFNRMKIQALTSCVALGKPPNLSVSASSSAKMRIDSPYRTHLIEFINLIGMKSWACPPWALDMCWPLSPRSTCTLSRHPETPPFPGLPGSNLSFPCVSNSVNGISLLTY